MIDLIIHDTLIYDGTGAPPRHGEIAIDGDTIASFASSGLNARETIDGRGLAIAPGFIDVHTHDDFAAVLHPSMAFKTEDGVTTCVVGNCGMGAAPWPQAAQIARAFDSKTLPQWDGYRGYFALFEQQPPATNIAALIGHGTVRRAAMGADAREPTKIEMNAMKVFVAEGLDAGAVGLSTGLIYDPGRHAQTDEIVELASLMRGTRGLYATHMRDEGLGLLASVAEAIAIGERAGVGVQISHHKASGKEAWGLVTKSLKLIEDAQRRGLDVHADQYPYTAGSTVFSAVFQDGGLGVNDPKDVVIASTKSHREWEGRSIAEIADTMACDRRQAATNILAAEPNSTVVVHIMCEEDVRTVMRHPSTMIGSDGLPTLEGKPHPRLYGTFARVLGHYARDEGLFPLEEAIYRMTGFPAAKFGFSDRGVLRVGAKADLVLFSPNRIIDRGTFENPKCSPEGIAAVYVNGQLTVQDGRSTDARAGRVLRH
jgi:N-acyl-D-amino-acid deacylase